MKSKDNSMPEPKYKTTDYHGAIVVTEDSLDRIINALQSFNSNLLYKCRVDSSSGFPHEFEQEQLCFVKTVGNPRSSRITMISIEGKSNQAHLIYILSINNPSLTASWKGIDTEAESQLRKFITSEIKNIRSFYWPITILLTWLLSGWRAIAGSILWLFFSVYYLHDLRTLMAI
ncbi:MAG: hypothetical protein NTZ78_03475 [Candidatus Aureabacteria bacterium]|nr:hypothetical protein [Candidatus Auribacterota bacterium]